MPLSGCVKFWGDAAFRIPTREIFDILAVTGGVPKYLEEINPALSAAENLRRMCFHLENALVTSAAPYVKKGSRKTGVSGCQVDLLIQTAESFCLVEIKRKARIGLEIIDEMKKKVETFPAVKGKAVRTALVYDGDLDTVVSAQGYFDAIVSFDRLLGM